MIPDHYGGRGLSDAELLSRWLNEAEEGGGAVLVVVFARYRQLVRSELEAGGLSALEAVRKVGTVLHRAQRARPDLVGLPLRERLVTVAREVAKNAISS